MSGLWRNDPETREGKYLVTRRDGTVPEWANFVFGERDPAAPAGLRAYADEAERLGFDPAYVTDLRLMADDWARVSFKNPGDPDAPRHRTDDPATVARMRGEPAASKSPADEPGWEWMAVEVFGHRSHLGRTREEERFGAKFLRIDVPVDGDPDAKGWQTHFYGGASIFSIRLIDRESALAANRPYTPPARFALPGARAVVADSDLDDPADDSTSDLDI